MKFFLTPFLLLCIIVTATAQNKQVIRVDESSTVKGLDISASGFAYSIEDAVGRIEYYRNKRFRKHKRLGVTGRRYDAGSCWFDMAKMDNFRKEINEYLIKLDPKDKVSGFRFYYINYLKNDQHASQGLQDMNKSTKKIHSLLIVATHLVPKCGGCIEMIERDVIDQNQKIAALVVKLGGFQNEGTLCPPQPPKDCGGATLINILYP
jgi:hypothetical protein